MNRFMRPILTLVLLILLTSVTLTQTAVESSSYATHITWSPDGLFIGVSGYGLMQVFDVINGDRIVDLPIGENQTLGHDWSADSKRLAVIYQNALHIWDLPTQTLLFKSDPNIRVSSILQAVDWSMDGTLLMTAHSSGSLSRLVFIWDANTYEILQVISPLSATHIKLDPTNRYLATYNLVGPYVYDLTTPHMPPIELEGRPANAFDWSQDGSRLIVGHGNGLVVVWDLQNQSQITTFSTGSNEDFTDLSWSSDHLQVALVTGNLSVNVWNVQNGELVYKTEPSTSFGVDFSPYGGQIAFSNLYSTMSNSNARLLSDGLIQIVVPDPSIERLNAIAESCLAPEIGVASVSDETRLSEFVTTIEALSDDQIPPGCKADLLAVAEAIQAIE
ncbi:MAG: hypothetical protein MUF87_19225 [Anaerolineae bacterium]|jgi:WD40 repeat protein|nr:hypothetical protein [Anaerolineae bacterium]